jgi:hypothetical protein
MKKLFFCYILVSFKGGTPKGSAIAKDQFADVKASYKGQQ